MPELHLISGNEAVALSVLHRGFALATGYPGTPSTEILESIATLADRDVARIKAQWAPNEKVALEVGLGAALAGARAIVTMKHVGVNVAADALFSAAYLSIPGALIVISADDPGMASSQNEQDNRRYAIAAGLPMLEPSDSQQAYDYLGFAVEIAERWQVPVMLRLTTRICHSKSVVRTNRDETELVRPTYTRDVAGRVLMPQFARTAHRQLRAKLDEIRCWSESSPVNHVYPGSNELGIVSSGVSVMHAREAAPHASVLSLGMSHPAPIDKLRAFVQSVKRCVVVEEGDPILLELAHCLQLPVEGRPDTYRFGELNTDRVRSMLDGCTSEPVAVPRGKAPELCVGCSHRSVFEVLARNQLGISGDIGCYTLAALPPYSAIDSVVCMGASIGVGLGLRHVLTNDQAQRVVSVIGDGTFIHSGITGLIEMLYNPPPTGHVVIILDNDTTAMTGQQEHPGTGRALDHTPTARLSIENVARALGVPWVEVIDPRQDMDHFEHTLLEMLASQKPCVLVARRPCVLAARRRKSADLAESKPCQATCPGAVGVEPCI